MYSCCIFNVSDLTNGQFIITPMNTCAFIGEMIDLKCSLKRRNVTQSWKGPDGQYISHDLEVAKNYKNKYVIHGEYNLHILNLTFADAGTYTCEDSTEHKNPYSAQVIAIGK